MSAEADAAIGRLRAAFGEMQALGVGVDLGEVIPLVQMSALISIAESLHAITKILPNVGVNAPQVPRRVSW